MRIKTSFVTNSSSANFIIPKKKITKEQLTLILHHIQIGKIIMPAEERRYFNESDEWLIGESGGKIHGSTSMTNFDMLKYLTLIGVRREDVQYQRDE